MQTQFLVRAESNLIKRTSPILFSQSTLFLQFSSFRYSEWNRARSWQLPLPVFSISVFCSKFAEFQDCMYLGYFGSLTMKTWIHGTIKRGGKILLYSTRFFLIREMNLNQSYLRYDLRHKFGCMKIYLTVVNWWTLTSLAPPPHSLSILIMRQICQGS